MKNILFFITIIFVYISGALFARAPSSDDSSSDSSEYSWTLEYTDPVELAEEVISSSSAFWSPLGYRIMKMKYTIGRFGAQHGMGYLLLESPRLAISMIGSGFYGVVSTVSKDFLLEVIEKSVGSPRVICENIFNAVITQGLDDYERAYDIARRFIELGALSESEALEFLDARWSIYRIVFAEDLYNATISHDYSISTQVRDELIQDITSELIRDYQSSLGSGSSIPVTEFAFFLNDLTNILENSDVGLLKYEPYIDFSARMESLNSIRLHERKRFTPDVILQCPYCTEQFREQLELNNHIAEVHRFVKSADVITDNVTGLQWGVWPSGGSWYEAKRWVDSLGDGWRLSTRQELQTLYNAGITRYNWGLFGSNGSYGEGHVWTGDVRDDSGAWVIRFHSGEAFCFSKADANEWVFAVRSSNTDDSMPLQSLISGIGVGSPWSEVIDLMEPPDSMSESTYQGASGLWIQEWIYEGENVVFVMSSTHESGPQTVFLIWLYGDCSRPDLKTSHGLCIGSTEAEVIAEHGSIRDDDFSIDGDFFVAGSIYGGIGFRFTDGVVSSITIGAMAE